MSMSAMYEICVFENNRLYDSQIVEEWIAIETFINMCHTYVNPESVPKERTEFSSGSMFASYSDLSGKMVMLFCPMDIDRVGIIKSRLSYLYGNKCADCGATITYGLVLCDGPDCSYSALY